MTTSALLYLFSDGVGPAGHPKDIQGWALLLTILLGEHAFLIARWVVRIAINKLESPGLQRERRERFLVRQKYFDESLNELSKFPPLSEKGGDPVPITRESLEEAQRELSVKGHGGLEERFWRRQQGWAETVKIGTGLIERATSEEGKKKQ